MDYLWSVEIGFWKWIMEMEMDMDAVVVRG